MTVSDKHLYTLADLAWGPMDAKEAALWLGTTYDGFRSLAPSLPRRKLPNLGWRYYRGELYEWSLGGNDVATDTHTYSQVLTAVPSPEKPNKRKSGVKRLI